MKKEIGIWRQGSFDEWNVFVVQSPAPFSSEVGWWDGEYDHIYPPEQIREFCHLLLAACGEAEKKE